MSVPLTAACILPALQTRTQVTQVLSSPVFVHVDVPLPEGAPTSDAVIEISEESAFPFTVLVVGTLVFVSSFTALLVGIVVSSLPRVVTIVLLDDFATLFPPPRRIVSVVNVQSAVTSQVQVAVELIVKFG